MIRFLIPFSVLMAPVQVFAQSGRPPLQYSVIGTRGSIAPMDFNIINAYITLCEREDPRMTIQELRVCSQERMHLNPRYTGWYLIFVHLFT